MEKYIFNPCVIKYKTDLVWMDIYAYIEIVSVKFLTTEIISSTFRCVWRIVCKRRQVKILLTQISVHVGIYHFLFIAYKFYGNTRYGTRN